MDIFIVPVILGTIYFYASCKFFEWLLYTLNVYAPLVNTGANSSTPRTCNSTGTVALLLPLLPETVQDTLKLYCWGTISGDDWGSTFDSKSSEPINVSRPVDGLSDKICNWEEIVL